MYLQIASARDENDLSRFWGLNTDYVRLFYISSPSSDFGKENRLAIEWKYGEPFWPSGRAFRLVFTNELIDVLKTMSYTERLMYVAAIYLELHRSDEVCAWYYEARYKLTRDDYENFISSDSGDANCDGEVNAIDLLLLKKYLAGYEPAFDPYLAAINRDNRISMLDVF